MKAVNLNRLIVTGYLKDRATLSVLASGCPICTFEVENCCRRPDAETGTWIVRESTFDVAVFGELAERIGDLMGAGREVAIDGWLEVRYFATNARTVRIVAEAIELLDGSRPRKSPRDSARIRNSGLSLVPN